MEIIKKKGIIFQLLYFRKQYLNMKLKHKKE